MEFDSALTYAIDDFKENYANTLTLEKTNKPQFVKLPEIPEDWKREPRLQE